MVVVVVVGLVTVVVGQFPPDASRLAILVPGQHPNARVSQFISVDVVAVVVVVVGLVARVCVVVAQLLPFASRFSTSVPGQQPCVKVSQFVFAVVGIVVVVAITQFVPSRFRFAALPSGQHPNLDDSHFAEALAKIPRMSRNTFHVAAGMTQFVPFSSRLAVLVPVRVSVSVWR